jgi:hypothetical protein
MDIGSDEHCSLAHRAHDYLAKLHTGYADVIVRHRSPIFAAAVEPILIARAAASLGSLIPSSVSGYGVCVALLHYWTMTMCLKASSWSMKFRGAIRQDPPRFDGPARCHTQPLNFPKLPDCLGWQVAFNR